MTHRERFFAVVEGRRPDRPVFFPDISDWYAAARTPAGQPGRSGAGRFIADDDPMHAESGSMPQRFAGWTYLDFYRNFDWGLPVHIYDWYRLAYDGVEHSVRQEGRRRITRLRCPNGELEKVDTLAADGSWAPTVHLAKDLTDLEIIRYVVEHSQPVPRYDRVAEVLEGIGRQGVADVAVMRSPFGKLVHEYLGFEKVVYALYDDRQAVLDFMAFQEARDLEMVALAAGSPARIVILSDHADENLISPAYYREYCIPFYRKAAEILHQAGKVFSTHLDGNFKNYFPLLAETGFDLLDGCTPAPMMNYEPEELAAALPEGLACYCGVPATLLCQHLPDEEIVDFGRRILDAFAGRVILNIGDILPPNGDIQQVIRLGEMSRSWIR
ncbi:MAG: hypothetical protein AMJ81_12070 [Phycisphaerae bacterium SM23_33]|jgi:hypothetical protein|nr:MAG: hypothetical protein AMJ81_12070 [Phycisphaerae bacterium SM23_33]